MPRVTLAFDLPDEAEELSTALKGGEYVCALCDIDQLARSALKYGGRPLSEVLEEIRMMVCETGAVS